MKRVAYLLLERKPVTQSFLFFSFFSPLLQLDAKLKQISDLIKEALQNNPLRLKNLDDIGQ